MAKGALPGGTCFHYVLQASCWPPCRRYDLVVGITARRAAAGTWMAKLTQAGSGLVAEPLLMLLLPKRLYSEDWQM
jgi:hypothetical protein